MFIKKQLIMAITVAGRTIRMTDYLDTKLEESLAT